MKRFIIDIPSYIEGEFISHRIQEKVFEFINKKDMDYISNYEILIRHIDSGNHHLKDLINDWGLTYKQFTSSNPSPTNTDKVNIIRDMVKECENGYALIFFDHRKKDDDIGNKILLDQCSNNDKIRSSVCRMDFGDDLY